ncbi:MAG: DUF4199 domain-containing protein [Novosphingobium sp.]
MTRLVLVFGILAGIIELALLGLSMGLASDHGILGMVLGYLSMLIALSLVFVGVRKYRDEHRGGVIRFWPALGVGLGIAGIAALFYVLGWEAYMWSTDYRFMTDYVAATLKAMEAKGASAGQLAQARAEFAEFAAMYENPVTRMGITLTEIAPVALLVPLISAALLRRPGFMPARAR